MGRVDPAGVQRGREPALASPDAGEEHQAVVGRLDFVVKRGLCAGEQLGQCVFKGSLGLMAPVQSSGNVGNALPSIRDKARARVAQFVMGDAHQANGRFRTSGAVVLKPDAAVFQEGGPWPTRHHGPLSASAPCSSFLSGIACSSSAGAYCPLVPPSTPVASCRAYCAGGLRKT
jgi:hypothetical protein